jgi:hypothetical protein
MPEGYRHAVRDNPFFVVDEGGRPVATGYLDLARPAWKPSLRCPNGAEKVAPE